jgi:putative nucleotidyltransferase with HDIG domain
MSTVQSKGGLWDFLLRLFGASKSNSTNPAVLATVVEETEADDEGPYVIAPGGYRIHVPQTTDVNHCVGDMLPSVRDGLSILPPLPKVVTDLLREIQDPKSTAASVADIASSDPALAASLIRTVNAAAVGLSRKISSVSEAVSYLGFGAVKSMVVRLRLEEVLTPRNSERAMDTEDLWVHSLAVSYAAECLARRVNGMDPGFAATLGLLHDIGKLAIIAQLPKESAALKSAESSLANEAKLLGVDHAGIGANLGAQWKLPADLVQAIRYHHFPRQAYHPTDPLPLRQAVYVLQIANQLAKYCFTHADSVEIEQVSDEAFALLGIEASLPKLLDAKMRAAIGRAVLLADANTRRSAATPRRFLRILTGEQAMQAATARSTASRVTVDDAAIDELLSENVKMYVENSIASEARFESAIDDASLAQCEKRARAHQDTLAMSGESRSIMALMVRSLLPNLAQTTRALTTNPQDKIEIAQVLDAGRMRLAFRCVALSTALRLGREAAADEPARLAEAELANVLNLGWFERIAISADGSSILFERTA